MGQRLRLWGREVDELVAEPANGGVAEFVGEGITESVVESVAGAAGAVAVGCETEAMTDSKRGECLRLCQNL